MNFAKHLGHGGTFRALLLFRNLRKETRNAATNSHHLGFLLVNTRTLNKYQLMLTSAEKQGICTKYNVFRKMALGTLHFNAPVQYTVCAYLVKTLLKKNDTEVKVLQNTDQYILFPLFWLFLSSPYFENSREKNLFWALLRHFLSFWLYYDIHFVLMCRPCNSGGNESCGAYDNRWTLEWSRLETTIK